MPSQFDISNAKAKFLQHLRNQAKCTPEPSPDELEEVNKLIDEERELIYQETIESHNEYLAHHDTLEEVTPEDLLSEVKEIALESSINNVYK